MGHVKLCIEVPKVDTGERSDPTPPLPPPPAKRTERSDPPPPPPPAKRRRKTSVFDVCGDEIGSRFASHREKCLRNQRKKEAKESEKENLKCPNCKKPLKSTVYFQKHLQVCNPKPSFSCATCSESFNHSGNRDRHERSCSGKVKPAKQVTTKVFGMQCKKYQAKFKLQRIFQMHLQRCSGDPNDEVPDITCDTCGRLFDNDVLYDKHVHRNTCKDQKDKNLLCNICKKLFRNRSQLKGHVCVKYTCSKCDKTSVHQSSKIKHEKNCQQKLYKCSVCLEGFDTRSEKAKHERVCKVTKKNTQLKYQCNQCEMRFGTKHEQHVHKGNAHPQKGTGELQDAPWGDDPNDAPWVDENGRINENLARVYKADELLILAPSEETSQPRVYNLPVRHDVQMHDVMDFVRHIHGRQQHAYRINLTFGYILRNRATGQYRYYKPVPNQGFLTHPFRITTVNDIGSLEKFLKKMEFFQSVQNKRPNTRWTLEVLTNLQATMYPLDFVIGNGPLPEYITKSHKVS